MGINNENSNQNKLTDKTQEELMKAEWENLTFEEKILRGTLSGHPDMTLEEAIEYYDMIP